MTSDELSELVHRELQQWGVLVLQRLAREIQNKNLVLTEETLKSLQAEVMQAAGSATKQLHLAFAESGRIHDMKGVDRKHLPPVEEMEKFVRSVGVSKFKYVPGYKGTSPLSENAAVKRIAWGIAVGRLNDNTHKPKKWFARPFYQMLNPLIDNIVTKYQDATGQIIGGIAKF